MDTLSVKVPESLAEAVETYADDHHDGNTSAAVRALLRGGLDAEQEIAELERDLEHARARQDELREMLKAANRRNEETQALVECVEQQDRSVVERLQSWFK